jgi:alkylation response protein AidB-like acyl-CoA dehydrogenase
VDFSWHPQTLELIAEYERFAAACLAQRPAQDGLDREAWRACSERGLLRLLDADDTHPHTRGLLPTVAVFEVLGRFGADRGLLFALGAHLFGCQMPICRGHRGDAPLRRKSRYPQTCPNKRATSLVS